jgi:hypothetical protein
MYKYIYNSEPNKTYQVHSSECQGKQNKNLE